MLHDKAYFETKEIPTSGNAWLGELTGGANFYGYSNPAFDAACEQMKTAGLDKAVLKQSADSLLQTLSNDLPFFPLFHFPEGFLYRSTLCNSVGFQTEAGLFAGIDQLNDTGECH